MDRYTSSPEQQNPDPLRATFDRGIRLVITYGIIDAEYERPYHNEQYPRLNHRGQHASSFELKTKLTPDETCRANALELYYTDEYIDEEGQLNEAGRLLATLRYPEGYARDIWLKLQPDGTVKSEVQLDMVVSGHQEVFGDLTPQQKGAVLEAIGDGDERRLTELVENNSLLEHFAERIITIVVPHSSAAMSVEEFAELRDALSQVEAAL